MKVLLSFFFLISTIVWAQPWIPPITVTGDNFSFSASDRIESISEEGGTHVLINSNGTLKYSFINLLGKVELNRTIDNGVVYNTSYDNYTFSICSSGDWLYAVYLKENSLVISGSNNSGDTWSILSSRSINNNISNGVDAIADFRGVHIVWATQHPYTDPLFDTFYIRYNDVQNSWEDFKQVSTNAGRPFIASSQNKIHIGYMMGITIDPQFPGSLGTIDLDLSANPYQWGNPQYIVLQNDELIPTPNFTIDHHITLAARAAVQNGYLHVIIYELVVQNYGANQFMTTFVLHKKRAINSSTWDPAIQLARTALYPLIGKIPKPVVTSSNTLHYVTAYVPFLGECTLIHFYFDGNTWKNNASFSVAYNYFSYTLSNYNNKLHCFWISEIDNTDLFHYSTFEENPGSELVVKEYKNPIDFMKYYNMLDKNNFNIEGGN